MMCCAAHCAFPSGTPWQCAARQATYNMHDHLQPLTLLAPCPAPVRVLLQALPLVHAPLKHLQRLHLLAAVHHPQLVEVLGACLSTTRSLTLTMPAGADGVLPDLSACCHLTQLVWTTKPPSAEAMMQAAAAAGGVAVAEPPDSEDLLWVLRGCGGLVELTLCGWTWLDARLALALAGAHPALRRLKLEGCGSLPGNSRGSSQQRLQRIRSLLRPSLVLEVV